MIKIKIAVLSDIHGNIVALDKVLEDAKNNGVEKYIFTGDLITELPFCNEVIDRLKEINAIGVKGNKEEYILQIDAVRNRWDNIQFKNSIFMSDIVNEENRKFIEELPFEMDLTIENVKMKIVHGSLESLTEIVWMDNTRAIDKYTKMVDADILICGHTHEPIWFKEMNGTTYLNCGCIGMSPYNPRQAEYVILDIEDGHYSIEKRLLSYDVNKMVEMVSKHPINEVDKVFMNIICLVILGRPEVRKKIFTEGAEIMEERGGSVYNSDVPEIYQQFKLFDDDVWIALAEKYKDEFLY